MPRERSKSRAHLYPLTDRNAVLRLVSALASFSGILGESGYQTSTGSDRRLSGCFGISGQANGGAAFTPRRSVVRVPARPPKIQQLTDQTEPNLVSNSVKIDSVHRFAPGGPIAPFRGS